MSCKVLVLLLMLESCTTSPEEKRPPIAPVNPVPVPAKQLYRRNYFTLTKNTRLLLNLTTNTTKQHGAYLLKEIKNKCNYKLKISDSYTTYKAASSIQLILSPKSSISAQGFILHVAATKIILEASNKTGLYYGLDLLLQLLHKHNSKWLIPQTKIIDRPAHKVRAIGLDDSTALTLSKDFLRIAQKNRFNFFLATSRLDLTSETVKPLTKNLSPISINNGSILAFYKNVPASDTLVFKLRKEQLQPDSLKILSEAMWSQPQNLNLNKLLTKIKEINPKPSDK